MATVEVKVPDIGDFDEVAVIEVLVKVGDAVKAEQSLITVESDKASMEIPSSQAGVVKELKVQVGSKVKEGSVVLVLDGEGAAAAPAPAPSAAPAPAPAAAAPTSAPAAAPAAAGAGPIEVHVPDIGDFKDVAVIEVLVKPGDTIKAEQSLITVESDKASMEIPSSAAGVLKELKVKVGDTVNIGDLIAVVEGAASASSAAAPAAEEADAA
ncbi:MAG: dihydrolipoamide acetyltransferase, partial [Variovorax sp.]